MIVDIEAGGFDELIILLHPSVPDGVLKFAREHKTFKFAVVDALPDCEMIGQPEVKHKIVPVLHKGRHDYPHWHKGRW